MRIAAACAASACALALAAHAARPMVTDDARIVDAKACQLESWIKRNPDSTEYWALPACNFTGNLELTFGGARTHADGDAYLNVPVSASVIGDTWIAHLNAGAVHRRDEGRNVATWGFGNEVQLRNDLYFIPEVFRSEPGRPFYQVGLRYWVVKDFVQMDATYGNRLVSDGQHWISIGLRILTSPFMR